MSEVYVVQSPQYDPPKEGDELVGMITSKTNKNGTAKFKKDEDGSPFKVTSVAGGEEKDTFSFKGDNNKDVTLTTYYLEIETADGNDLPVQPAIQKSVPPTNKPAPLVESPDDRQRSIIRQHSQEMALRFLDLTGEKTASFKRVQEVSDWFENDANGEEPDQVPF